MSNSGSSHTKQATVWIIVGIATALTLFALMRDDSQSKRPSTMPAQSLPANSQSQEQLAALFQVQMVEAVDHAKELNDKLDKLADLHTRWMEFTQELLTNDAGRRLAASERSLITYTGLVSRQRTSPAEISSIRDRVETLITPIEQGLTASSFFQPAEPVLSALQKDLSEVDELLSRYEEGFDTLVSLSESGNPAPTTLKEAVAELKRRQAQERATLIAEAEAKAVVDGNQQIAEERGELKRKQLAIEAAEIADRRTQIEEEALKKSLIIECRRKDIRQKLAPFITSGKWLPYSKEGTLDARSHSWAMLRTNALRDNVVGYSQLIYIATCTDDKLRPRFKWDHPSFYNLHWRGGNGRMKTDEIGKETLEQVREVRELLIRLGPTLKELGDLAP